MKEKDLVLLRSLPGVSELVSDISSDGVSSLNASQRRELISALMDEFCRVGIEADAEPNAVGLWIEGIIGELSPGAWE